MTFEFDSRADIDVMSVADSSTWKSFAIIFRSNFCFLLELLTFQSVSASKTRRARR